MQPQIKSSNNVVVESRPGSGMSKIGGSSKYGSYTTLPRPEQVEVEDFQQQHYRYYPLQQHSKTQQQQVSTDKIPIYGANFYDKQANIYGGVNTIKANLANKVCKKTILYFVLLKFLKKKKYNF